MSRWIPITDQDPLRLADDLDDLYRDYAAKTRDAGEAVPPTLTNGNPKLLRRAETPPMNSGNV